MKRFTLITLFSLLALSALLTSSPRLLLRSEFQRVSLLETALREYLSQQESRPDQGTVGEILVIRDRFCPARFDPDIDGAQIRLVDWVDIQPAAESEWETWPWAVHFSAVEHDGNSVKLNVFHDPAVPEGIIALMGGGRAYRCTVVLTRWSCSEVGRIIR